MVKRLEDLSKTQKGIVTVLDVGQGNSLDINELKQRLEDNGYGTLSKEKIRDDVSELIKYGSVRTHEENGEMSYFLSRGFGSGRRNRGSLRGTTNFARDFYKLIQRLFSGVFLLSGLGFLFYQDKITTGNFVFESSAAALDIAFILSFVLMIIGGVLFFQSFKRN